MEYYIDPVTFVTQKSGFESRYIKNLLGLLDEGATIPFISRYRKEMTGSMDEVQVGTGARDLRAVQGIGKAEKDGVGEHRAAGETDPGTTATDRTLYRFTGTGRYLHAL